MSPESPRVSVSQEGPRLRFGQGLQSKLALLFLLVTVAISYAAWQAGKILVQDQLVEDTRRYQRESGLRMTQGTEAMLLRAEALAASIAQLVSSQRTAVWQSQIVPLSLASGLDQIIAGVGWWPASGSGGARRESRLWLVDGVGELQPRNDYQDSNAIAYWKESWFAPSRYASAEKCFWSRMYQDRLLRRKSVTCALPVRDRGGFRGAVTILLDVERIELELRKTSAGQSGYSLLLDRDNQIIASTGQAGARLKEAGARNMAELAQRHPAFNSLALDLHRRREDFLSRAVQSPFYEASAVSELTDAAPDTSRQDAESDLALIWNTAAVEASAPTAPEELLVPGDPFIGDAGAATLFELGAPYWKLVRVTAAKEGLAGAQYFFQQSLVAVIGMVALTLVLIYAAMRFLVLRPLSRMASSLSRVRSTEESLRTPLKASAKNEIGVISHWYNERLRLLRESNDRVVTQQSQLVVEAGERARADDQSLRMRERNIAMLASISDAAILVDARGQIEGMNANAERMTGVDNREARGRPCNEVLRLRLANQDDIIPDFGASVIASSERVEYGDGLFLRSEVGSEQEIRFIGTPLHGPDGRSLGATLIFSPRESHNSPSRVVIDRRSNDPVTGLATRPACDRRLRDLMANSGNSEQANALLVIDVDQLRHINDQYGMQAGDEALVRIAELLVQESGGADVFRLGADAFAIVLEGQDNEGAAALAEQLCKAVRAADAQWAKNRLDLSIHVGVVDVGGSKNMAPLELLRRGNLACAQAKSRKDCSVAAYEESIDSVAREPDEALWIRRIRNGLDEGLLHLTTQQLKGHGKNESDLAFRVSVALEDEEGFWAEPESFLPVAKRNGTVAEIERWAMIKTLEHFSRNPDVLSRVGLCLIHLSPETIADSTTLEALANSFQQHSALEPERICLMMNYDAIEQVPHPTQVFCEAAKGLRCQLALQQRAARSASAHEVSRKLAVDYEYLDARHFPQLGDDVLDRLRAQGAIQLARAQERGIIVTEISDEAGMQAWSDLGVDYLQGPAIARPSPVIFAVPN